MPGVGHHPPCFKFTTYELDSAIHITLDIRVDLLESITVVPAAVTSIDPPTRPEQLRFVVSMQEGCLCHCYVVVC